ncbi:DUF4179 domain-containing protein [Sporosarcina sp. Te-1]|uniref:DUF4179 domain-containing protein n=1 Tax=Sporosarcina sp. Te-1 TaxID=2818390 RepID=UPI001A9F131F|nr:DUF4179 domain-containing protein [Sporosarcina sp. Te-1]QTD43464.1 DUF4179 domain-containing protein [Sporosarcina sp. Te-1]
MECKNAQDQMIDYLEGNLNEWERKEFELHMEECAACKEELVKLKQLITSLEEESEAIHVPESLMKNVRASVASTQWSKRKTVKRTALIGAAAALFLTVFVGTAIATNGFATFADWWKDFGNKQEEQVENFVQQGLGDKVNAVAESNGIKITITNVVADDMQTLVYYEIEDQKRENEYLIDFTRGLKIDNQDELFNSKEERDYSPVSNHLRLHSENPHISKGRLGMGPLSKEEGTIQLSLNKVQSLDGTVEVDSSIKEPEYVEGDWHFEIPVKKHPAIIHDLNVETEYEGNPVIIDKLTIAPTVTVLSYRYRNENQDRNLDNLSISIAGIESKENYVTGSAFDFAGVGGSTYHSNGWSEENATFESLYFENPSHVKVHFGNMEFNVKEKADFPIDPSKPFPQTFTYLGTKISIDKVEIGQPTLITMSEELNANRVYQSLDYHFSDADDHNKSTVINPDGYFIDKNGKKYKASEYFYLMNELEEPVLYSTEHHIKISRKDSQDFIPAKLSIDGYRMIEYSEKVVDIPLD